MGLLIIKSFSVLIDTSTIAPYTQEPDFTRQPLHFTSLFTKIIKSTSISAVFWSKLNPLQQDFCENNYFFHRLNLNFKIVLDQNYSNQTMQSKEGGFCAY
jgi:hypothetical protein